MRGASGRTGTNLSTGIHRGLHSGTAAAEFLNRHAAQSHSVAAGYFVAESSDQIMTVRLITTWDDLAALEQPWNALSDGMPMRRWDWLATWWKHYGCCPLPAESGCSATWRSSASCLGRLRRRSMQQQWARLQAGAARYCPVVSRSHGRQRQCASLARQRRSMHRSPLLDLPSATPRRKWPPQSQMP